MLSLETPFYHQHIKRNAKMVDFASFKMPIYYEGIKKEHLAVRSDAGLFDISHMGEFIIEGEAAQQFISYLTPNKASNLITGKVQYSALLNKEGNFIDDILIYGLSVPYQYMLVVNASNIEKDKAWILQHKPEDIQFSDVSASTCLLALQGPKALKILQPLCDINLNEISYYSFITAGVGGVKDVIISATGYTGESGFELYFDKSGANIMWEQLIHNGFPKGLLLAGLGCRDTLRIEMGFPLYGNDISELINPKEAKLSWIIKNPSEFLGKKALENIEQTDKVRIGFIIEGRGIARPHQYITDENQQVIGQVTSATLAPSIQRAVGMGYVKRSYLETKSTIWIQQKNTLLQATITKYPFLKK